MTSLHLEFVGKDYGRKKLRIRFPCFGEVYKQGL